MTAKNDFDVEVDLRDLLMVLKKGLPILVLIPLLCMIIAGYVSLYHLAPFYRASTTLIVSKIYTFDDKQYIHYEDLLIANQLVSTYSQIAKSRSVCEQVTAINGLDMTPESFSAKITVQAIKDTQLISLSITDTDPVVAARLANQTAVVFMEKAKEIMHFNNVKIVDAATVPETPVGPSVKRNIILAGVMGLFTAFLVIFARQFLKQTFESSEEVEQLLEMPVLASIPGINTKSNPGGIKNAAP